MAENPVTVQTQQGLLVLAAGGTLEEAEAADAAEVARWEAEAEAAAELTRLEIRRKKLVNADLETRIKARLERLERRRRGSAASGTGGDTDTHDES